MDFEICQKCGCSQAAMKSLAAARDELKKQLAEAMELALAEIKAAGEMQARMSIAERQLADMREGVKVVVEALERIAKNPGVTLTSYPPRDFGQYTAAAALEQARKLGIVEGQK